MMQLWPRVFCFIVQCQVIGTAIGDVIGITSIVRGSVKCIERHQRLGSYLCDFTVNNFVDQTSMTSQKDGFHVTCISPSTLSL